jgi:hypothetical protein
MNDTQSASKPQGRERLDRPLPMRRTRRSTAIYSSFDPAEDGRRLGTKLAADFRRKVEGLQKLENT